MTVFFKHLVLNQMQNKGCKSVQQEGVTLYYTVVFQLENRD